MLEMEEMASLIPGLRRSLGGGHSNLVLYSCLKNRMDRGDAGCSPWSHTAEGAHTALGHIMYSQHDLPEETPGSEK